MGEPILGLTDCDTFAYLLTQSTLTFDASATQPLNSNIRGRLTPTSDRVVPADFVLMESEVCGTAGPLPID